MNAYFDIDEQIRKLEAELQVLKNLKFAQSQNQQYQGNYQSQHYYNQSQADYFGKGK